MADIYPGWEKFDKRVQELRKKAKTDAEEIAKKLAERAKNVPDKHKCPCDAVTADQIADALKNPQGKNYDWSNWAGKFDGTWYGDKEYPDAQEWKPSEDCSATDSDAIQGVPAGKKCKKQHVIWTNPDGSKKKEGWNVSSADDDYVWGWDPKEGKAPEEHGKKGTHVGFPLKHEPGKCWCIVWVTSENEYLECITPDRKCKMSVDRWGHGQWKLVP